MGTKRRDKIIQPFPPYVRRPGGAIELCLPADWVRDDREQKIVVVVIDPDHIWGLVKTLATIE